MPRRPKRPSYAFHKASGQAYSRLNGRIIYLGKHGSPESKHRYDEVVAEWLTGQNSSKFTITLDELAIKYLKYCESYYLKDGVQTTEVGKARGVLRIVIRLSGRKLAREFGPQKLLAVRQEMFKLGWRRVTINQQIGRIRRCFKWGVEQELIPAETLTGLQAVSGLKAGRSEAKESEPVKPVSLDAVEAIRLQVSRQVWAMIRLQLLTGARPGEVAQMRGRDLTMGSELWEYRPASHKGQHHGRERLIFLGKEAQAIVREFLRADISEFLFRPEDARREFEEKRTASRKTPMTPSQQARQPTAKPKRKPGMKYTTASYGAAIRKACERAFDMPRELRNVSTELPTVERERLQAKARAWREDHCWHPHQLRHTAATEIRREFGIEAAQVILGHASISTAEIYAEKDRKLAEHVMQQRG